MNGVGTVGGLVLEHKSYSRSFKLDPEVSRELLKDLEESIEIVKERLEWSLLDDDYRTFRVPTRGNRAKLWLAQKLRDWAWRLDPDDY